MRTLRGRFVLSHVLPILVVIPVVGIALTYLLETQVLLAGLSSELERQAGLVAAVAVGYPEIWFDQDQAQGFTSVIAERLTAQVALLDPTGKLITSTDPADRSILGQRPEIPGLREALTTGRVIRVDYGGRPGTEAPQVLMPVLINGQVAGVIRLTDPLSSVYERFPRTRSLIIWVLAVGLVLGVGLGWFLALGLERPLRRATRAITAMTAGEPLGELPEQGPREMRMLLRAFNTLTEQLRGLEKARQRLLANLVHELGRPLGALLSAAQALHAGADEEPELRRELVEGMEAEIGRMGQVLADLTHLYDRTIGPLELMFTEVALAPWLAQVSSAWRETAQQRGLQWESEIPAGLPPVSIDADRMAQAVGNLLSNAVKYTVPGGRVSVSASATGDEVWIRVSDTGPGIPLEEQSRIFAPFYRGSAGRRFPQGMGLGLSIARDLVAAHNGVIEVKSTPGEGSTFTVRLPVERSLPVP